MNEHLTSCSKCGRLIDTRIEGYAVDPEGKRYCVFCWAKRMVAKKKASHASM